MNPSRNSKEITKGQLFQLSCPFNYMQIVSIATTILPTEVSQLLGALPMLDRARHSPWPVHLQDSLERDSRRRCTCVATDTRMSLQHLGVSVATRLRESVSRLLQG